MEGQQAFSEGTVLCFALNKPFFELEWRLAVLPLIGKIADMAFVLAEEQIEFIQRMIRRGPI